MSFSLQRACRLTQQMVIAKLEPLRAPVLISFFNTQSKRG
jgi:hypothetical protein